MGPDRGDPPAPGRPARPGPSRCGRWRRRPSTGCSPGSPSSIGCSAAASCRARSSCSAARRESARARSPEWRSGNLCAAGQSVLYVSGEESAAQVRLRAERLGERALAVPVLAETSVDAVLATLEAERPDACVIDSIQTLHVEGMTGAPGSVGQVREAAGGDHGGGQAARYGRDPGRARDQGRERSPDRARSSTWWTACCCSRASASAASAPCGRSRTASARPARSGSSRCARAGWSRSPIPRRASWARRARRRARACSASMEGTRPLLVEVQALVAPTEIVPPRRVATGIDRNRLAMILAVLARHGGPSLASARRVRQRRRRASGSTSRAPIWPSRWRWPRPIAGEPLGGAEGRAARLLRRGRADRRAALRRPPRAPRGRGAQVRPRPGPRSGGRRANRRARLRRRRWPPLWEPPQRRAPERGPPPERRRARRVGGARGPR